MKRLEICASCNNSKIKIILQKLYILLGGRISHGICKECEIKQNKEIEKHLNK